VGGLHAAKPCTWKEREVGRGESVGLRQKAGLAKPEWGRRQSIGCASQWPLSDPQPHPLPLPGWNASKGGGGGAEENKATSEEKENKFPEQQRERHAHHETAGFRQPRSALHFRPMSHGRGRACQSEGLHAGKPHFFSFLVLPCSMQSRLTFTTTPPITSVCCSLLADCNLPFPGETARGTSQSSL
jgi:hypothetical protein